MDNTSKPPMRIAGVPEHFNLPWRQRNWLHTHPSKAFEQILYQEFPGGTGAMTAAIANGDIDLAILLTEGAILDIVKGGRHQIVKSLCGYALEWGIHVAHGSTIHDVADMQGKTLCN